MADPQEAAATITARVPDVRPRVGLVLGTGLGELAATIGHAVSINYSELPGFPQPTVAGHVGRLVVGTLGGVPVACLQGRAHLYEGHAPATIAVPIRALRLLGCETLLLTNAAGSLDSNLAPGSLMLLRDHIDLLDDNPLIGPNDERFGPRFVDMTNAYDPGLRTRFAAAAGRLGITLNEGVYIAVTGPNFETPAEIRAFRTLGADAVGMSTVPECLVANHCGMRVAAISAITNMAAGLAHEALSHEQALAVGGATANDLGRLLIAFLEDLARDVGSANMSS